MSFTQKPEPSGNPMGFALGIFLELRLYFTVYLSSRHKTDTILQTILKRQYFKLK